MEDHFVAFEKPLSRGENVDNDISFTDMNSIDVDDGRHEDFEKTIATKFEVPYTGGGEEYAGEFDYTSESKQEYGSVECDSENQDEDGISLKSNSVGDDDGDFASVDNSSKSSSDDDSDNPLNVQPRTKKQRHVILFANTQETRNEKTTFDNDVKPESNNEKREGVTFASTKKPPQHNKSNDWNDMVNNLFSGDLTEEVAENEKNVPIQSQFQFTSWDPFATVKLARATGLRFMEIVVLLGCLSLNSSEAT